MLLISCCSFAQSTGILDISEAKRQLELLQNQLGKVDSELLDVEKQNEIERLEISSEEKGEFETTKQFESRQIKETKRIKQLEEEIASQIEERKISLQRKINQILSTEFKVTLDSATINLGTYDADKQLFPLIFRSSQREILIVPLAEAKEFKEGFAKAEKVGILGLSLNEQNRAKEYIIYATVKFNGKVYKTLGNSLSTAKAMEIVFGNFDFTTQVSKWTATSQDVFERRDTLTLKSIPLALKSFFVSGVEKKILLVQEQEEESGGCMACGRIFSYAIFIKGQNYWKVESVVKDAGEYGSSGTLGEPKFVKIGLDKYALMFWSGRASGFFDHYFEITDAHLKYLFTVETGADGDEIKVDVKFIPNAGKTYFDARVTTTGKKYMEVGKRFLLKAISKVETYIYINGKYQLVKK